MVRDFLRTVAFCLSVLFTSIAFAEIDTYSTSHFSGSGNCATCHNGLTDTSGNDVSIVKDWGNSMMANATKDPFWLAKVATELERNPALATVINDKCTKCHAPVANYEITKVQGEEITLFGPDGILKPEHALYDAGLNGVTCTVCHQITDDATLGTLAGFSGNYNINNTKTIYGQYSNITGQPMINSTGYTPTYSAHISDSAICATCHNLKTPYVDAQGNVLSTTAESEFPEQMPYTEWQNSIFDDAGSNPQSCQDCHMPKTTSIVSTRPNFLAPKANFAKHELVGANTTMLTLLRDNATQLGVISTDLDQSITRARNMLQSSVNLEIVSAAVTDGVLEARVKLLNKSGHKTPTAYPSRRMWLNFKLTDSANNIIFESGHVNADGSIDGAINDVDQSQFEPHYNTITSADQVQIYETILGDSDGALTFTLLRGMQYLKDNRLTPQGFNKLAVPDDVAVHGLALNDADFNQGSDEVVYRIPLEVAGNIDVDVSLKYQTIAHGVLEDLYSDNTLEQVQNFKAMYDAQSLKYEQISSVQTSVVSDYVAPLVPVVTLSSTHSIINPGQSSTLNWSSTDASNCVATDGWSGSRLLSGLETVTPAVTTSYTLNCSGDGGSDTQSVTIIVNTPSVPVISLTAAPSTIDQGQSSAISWSASSATSCVASGGWSGNRATADTEVVTPSVTSSYTLTCSGAGGSDTKTVSVVVNTLPLPTLNLSITPSVIVEGESTYISWNSTEALSCSASGDWLGNRGISGSEELAPTNSSSYTLNCSGAGGSIDKTVSVSVNAVSAPVINISATPQAINSGETLTIRWNVLYATSCEASGDWSGVRISNGSEVVTPGVSSGYSLTCMGTGGSSSETVNVDVNVLPVISLSATALTIDQGQSTTINWEVANASSCTASGGWRGSRSTSGSEIVSPSATASYTLDCTGNGNTESKTINVSVNNSSVGGGSSGGSLNPFILLLIAAMRLLSFRKK